jgi:quinol monooxygenase YgiN
MNDQEINVVVKLKLKKEVAEEAKKGLNNLQIDTRQEPGCNLYRLHQSLDDETVLVIYESWQDKASLDRHFQSPHYTRWLEKAENYTVGLAEVTILKKL